MKSLRFTSMLIRLALVVTGLSAIAGAGCGLWQGVAEHYWGWSDYLFWRVTAHAALIGVFVGLGLSALAIVQAAVFRLFLAPRRALAALACGWLTTLPFLAAAPVVLRALLQSTPAAKMPLFAADAVSMEVFIGRILAGALLPERLPSLFLSRPVVLAPPLLAPLLLGLIVYLLLRRPIGRRLGDEATRPVHLLRWIALIVIASSAAAGPALATWRMRPASNLPNLVLISIDTLRADALGVYGAPVSAAPHLDQLAARGVRFTTVRAPSSWTLPSHAALLTGRWPWRLGVRRVADAVPRSAIMLAEVLAARGYETRAVVSHLFVDAPYGFGQGYDEVEHAPTERAADAAALALRWLRRRDAHAPYFLFLHLYDPHWPYDPQSEIPSTLLGDTALADRVHVQEFTDYLDLAQAMRQGPPGLTERADAARQAGRPTIVAVVSDHGDLFGEHGMYGHGITLFEPEIRVPWIIAGPNLPPGKVVDGPVSLVDVAPTLLGLLGLGGGLGEIDGLDLSSAVRGEKPVPTPRWLGGENLFVSATPARYVSDGRWKWFSGVELQLKTMHLAFGPLLTRTDLDPGELKNLLDDAMAAQIAAVAHALFSGAERSERAVSLTDEEKQRLRALGYLPH